MKIRHHTLLLILLLSSSVFIGATDQNLSLSQFAADIFSKNILKVNSVPLAHGNKAPLYLDLREIFGFPELRAKVIDAFACKIQEQSLSFDLIAGAPFTGTVFAAMLAQKLKVKFVLDRKAKKGYGTNKLVEGVFAPNERCLLIDDVIASGDSLLESIRHLESVGLKVTDVMVIVDKEEGGLERLSQKHIRTHSLFKLSAILADLGFAENKSFPLKYSTKKLDDDYILEAEDRRHRKGDALHQKYLEFITLYGQRAAIENNRLLFWQWLDKQKNEIPSVSYLTPDEREQFKVRFSENQKIVGATEFKSGSGENKQWIFVMDDVGRFYLAAKELGNTQGINGFHHSSFFAGAPVAAAGAFLIDEKTQSLVGVSDISGHYKGREIEVLRVLDSLKKQGVDLNAVKLDFFAMEETRSRFFIPKDLTLTAEAWRLILLEHLADLSGSLYD